ncbi:methylenetetrahydrofolate dehydrogenase [Bradyrhizobium lupini HPC(L)]|uniref:Bifunctional protein FolD n=1 Tax=Bradyrhizobium lupini HPC(L) TaxID=1229491 RepID=A0ABP2RRW9_RHILU|nr:methylenetetrahydrofolate dehydrogenase [Bradyrhizobium lupini HPC(L)]
MNAEIKTQVISGKLAAEALLSEVKATTSELAKSGVQPGLAVVIVGNDPASQVYVSSKGKKAEECGFLSIKHELPEDAAEKDLLDLIASLNRDDSIHGILVQIPLPAHIDAGKVIQSISPQKDVDGFHFTNVGKLGTGMLETAFVPCTPAGSMRLIEQIHGKDLSGLTAVVVGRSNIVGKPMASLLLAANATVIIAHSRTKNLEAMCQQADILVAAVGRPKMIRADFLKPGATVIDVGINRVAAGPDEKSKLVGDVDFDGAIDRAGAITPVPGGVGPMTIAMLMSNTLRAASLAAALKIRTY